VKAAERKERDLRVVLMCMRQVPRKEVAEAFGLTDRQVRRIMANWREGAIRGDTERAVENVNRALETIRDDMDALGVAAAKAEPKDRIALLGLRMQQLNRNFSVLREAGVSFEGLFDKPEKDPYLVRDVNAAIRAAHEKHAVDPEVTETATAYAMDTLAEWGYGLGSGADTSPEDWMGGQDSWVKRPLFGPRADIQTDRK
jgi:hypothetical protein